MRITKLERDKDGHWTANITVAGHTYHVHKRFGSWMRDHPEKEGWLMEVPVVWAEALQERVRPIERAERKEAEANAKAA